MLSKRLLIIGAISCLMFTACAKNTVLVYNAHFDVTDAAKTAYLVDAVQRVMIRKLTALGVAHPNVISVPTNNSATVTFTMQNAEEIEIVKKVTTEPFSFDLRIEKAPASDAKPVDQDNWTKTDITGSFLAWVQPVAERESGKISLELQFTTEGKSKLNDVFAKNKGKMLGIFIRDFLISKMAIVDTTASDRILISGVPSSKIAEVVADDVNVGLRVTFK